MGIEDAYRLICDRCGQEAYIVSHYREEAMRTAYRDGWTERRAAILCQVCSEDDARNRRVRTLIGEVLQDTLNPPRRET